MALSFTSNLQYLRNASVPAVGAAGSIFIRIKPNWNSGDGVTHVFWHFANSIADYPSFQKYLDNNIYIGFYTGSEYRLILADTGIFVSGTWAKHLFTWDDTAETREYFVDNVSKASSSATWSRGTTQPELTIGNYTSAQGGQQDCNSTLAEFGFWDRTLNAADRATLQTTGTPISLPRGLVAWYPLWGKATAEPGWKNNYNLTIASGVAAAAHPPVIYPRRIWARAVAGAAPAATRGKFLTLLGVS